MRCVAVSAQSLARGTLGFGRVASRAGRLGLSAVAQAAVAAAQRASAKPAGGVAVLGRGRDAGAPDGVARRWAGVWLLGIIRRPTTKIPSGAPLADAASTYYAALGAIWTSYPMARSRFVRLMAVR